MTIDLMLVADWVMGLGLAVNCLAALLLWDSACEIAPSRYTMHRVMRVLFDGKRRSMATSQLLNAATFAVAAVLVPQTAPIRLFLGVLSGILLIGLMLPLMWMNLTIRSYSRAPKDSMRAHRIIEAYKHTEVDEKYISRLTCCIFGEVERGNQASAEILRDLIRRGDEVGCKVRQILLKLSATSSTLGMSLDTCEPGFDG